MQEGGVRKEKKRKEKRSSTVQLVGSRNPHVKRFPLDRLSAPNALVPLLHVLGHVRGMRAVDVAHQPLYVSKDAGFFPFRGAEHAAVVVRSSVTTSSTTATTNASHAGLLTAALLLLHVRFGQEDPPVLDPDCAGVQPLVVRDPFLGLLISAADAAVPWLHRRREDLALERAVLALPLLDVAVESRGPGLEM